VIVYDEASNLTPRMVRVALKHHRRQRATGLGWINWHINRGRLPLSPSKKELRALSWRRVK
jgi:hypothetical protein